MDKRQLVTAGWQNEADQQLQPPDTVRDIENLEITNLGGSSYSVKSIKGNDIAFIINPGYVAIRFHSALDKILVFSTNELGNGELGIVYINEITNTGLYIPLYNHRDLAFDKLFPIYSKFIRESPLFQRGYWWDNKNPPRAFNFADDFYQTYSSFPLTAGEQYMVVQGFVLSGVDTYGPGEALGTVFTAIGGVSDIPGAGTLVIGFRDPAILELTPSVDIGNIQFKKWLSGGNLQNGNWCYFYQIGDGEAFGPWSYITRPIHLTDDIPGGQPGYQEYQGMGVPSNFNTQKGIQIEISNIDINFPIIRVGAIHFTGIDVFDPPIIWAEEKITAPTMTFDHLNTYGLEPLSVEEILGARLSILKNKTGDINQNYLFLAHITLRQQPVFDPSVGAVVKACEIIMPSDTIDYFLGNHPTNATLSAFLNLIGHDPFITALPTILPGQWYIVEGTSGVDTVTYNGIVYDPDPLVGAGNVFQGVDVVANCTAITASTGAPVVTPILRIQKWTGVWNNIKIVEDYLDHKGMTASNFAKSGYRGQTYRTAMLLWDLNGNPTYAHWIKDYTFPEQYETDPVSGVEGTLVKEYTNSGGAGFTAFSLRTLGFEFDNINIKDISDNLGIAVADLPLYFRGFSIVRARLDSTVIAQGILWPTAVNPVTPLSPIEPQGSLRAHWSIVVIGGSVTYRRPNYYCFWSPDILFNYNDLPNKIEGDLIKIVDYYDDENQQFSAQGKGTVETNGDHWYHKFLYQQVTPGPLFTPVSTENELIVDNCKEIQVAQMGYSLASGIIFNNKTSVYRNVTQTGFDDRNAKCSKVFVLNTKDTEGIAADPLEYGFGVGNKEGVPAAPGIDNQIRPLVNYIRPKPSNALYGGSSESAKANTQYISMGHYQEFDTDFMTYLAGTAGIASGIQIYGGDAFVGIFDIERAIKDHDAEVALVPQISYGLIFPCESFTNFNLREGRHITKDRSYDGGGGVNPNGIAFGNNTWDKPEAFVYNPAYSNDNMLQIVFPAVPIDYRPNNVLEHTCYYSLKKQDGETLDNFRIIKLANYQNVDGVLGPITAVIAKRGKLYFIQSKAVGYLPVNEKQAITGTGGSDLIIGIGGVIPRYETNDDYYGSDSQSSVFLTEDGFGFFDYRRKTFCHVTTGVVDALSVYKGIRAFLVDALTLNDMNGSPFSGYGISAVYDGQRKQVIMSFRQSGSDATEGGDFTIIYDVLNKAFAGRYSWTSPIYLEHNDKIYSVFDRFSKMTIQDNTDYELYSFITEGTSKYMCILAYTSATPAVLPSLDATHWQLIVKSSEVYVHNVNDIGKFYGIVERCMLEIIFNDQPGKSKQIDNFEYQQDQGFWDNIRLENSWQVAEDIAIDVINNREYEFRNRIWMGTAPQDPNTGKMTDLWCKIQMTKTNLLGLNPTISKDELIKFVSLVTYFEITE